MTKTLKREFLVSPDAVGQIDSLSDESLMGAYQQGNGTCIEILIRRYERELYSYLRRMLPNEAAAEDVFQNTFLQIHLKRAHYEPGRPFRPWLYTLATNQAIDYLRKNRRHQQPSLDAATSDSEHGRASTFQELMASADIEPSEQAARRERRALVRSVVDGLAEPLRMVVVLSYYQGMKYKEVAQVLGIPVGTVKSRLHAAVHRLSEEWQRLGLMDQRE